MKSYSPGQFTLFRIVFGTYLACHFAGLVPYADELFSGEGVLADPKLSPLHGLLPNPLVWFPSAGFAVGFTVALLLLSIGLTVGWRRRWVAGLLWFGWAALFNRNPLISNPSLPYVGLILLFLTLVPEGEPWRWQGRQTPPSQWYFPRGIYAGAWFLLAAGYTFSGIVKLQSPSWVDGTAFRHLIDNPLARPGPIRDFFLGLPEGVLAVLTWSILAAEIAFLPLSLARRTRLGVWLAMLLMHAGIVLMVDFADLSLGMVMIHLFTFDPEWLPPRLPSPRPLLLYDGKCGLCNAVVRFLLREDSRGLLRFAPLQGPIGQEWLRRYGMDTADFDSLVLVHDRERNDSPHDLRTTAVLRVLAGLGGVWRVMSILKVLPGRWRDPWYKLVARLRYRLFGEYRPSPLPEASWAERIW